MSGAAKASKPSIFGKMYNFVKTVTERAMDPDAIPSDDENETSSDEDNAGLGYTVDFRQKYNLGNTVKLEFDVSLDTAVAPSEDDLVDVLKVDALSMESSEAEAEAERELESAIADECLAFSDGVPDMAGFVGRSTSTSFHTRVGPNYKVNKQKAPSAPALMELMSVDFVRTPCRVPDIGRYLNIPAEWSALDTHHPAVPPLFIVHIQTPNKWPTTVFVKTTDGPCYSSILVYRLTQDTVNALADLSTAPGAVKLFVQYCQAHYASTEEGIAAAAQAATAKLATSGAEVDGAGNGNVNGNSSRKQSPSGDSEYSKSGSSADWIGRTKVFVRCDNLKELMLPKFLRAYNGTPALIRESGTLFRGNGYLELDVNIRKFGLLANKTLPLLLSRLHFMDLHIGICIESREEEEMPECMLGCVRSHRVTADESVVPMWFVRKNA